MTLPDEVVKAVANAKCVLTDTPSACFPGESGGLAHPECAVAAVLRALPESEEACAAVHALMWNDRTAINILAAIARLADQ